MPNDIPALSKSQLGDNARPVERIREELQVLLGMRGDPMDKAITLREAVARGLIDSTGRALSGSTSAASGSGGAGGATGDEPDLTPPPTPSGLVVIAGFTQVLVQWDAPTYTQGRGNGFTNVYAVKKATTDASLPTFEPGVTPKVFVAPGALNIVSLPSELNTRWHVWIKFETVDGVESLAPAGGINGYNEAGAFPTTGQDISQLLALLTGGITESHLNTALGERITAVGGLESQYTVKVDTNGYVSGFGLASTANGATPTSSFIIRADKFAVSSPSGPGLSPVTPFVVNTTTQTENGVSIPPGVYMDGAYIRNLNAAIARLGSAWIDDAKIANLSAAKLSVGDGTVGGNLKSSSFAAGSGLTPGTGWRLTPGGTLEASGAVIYGTIYASAGVFSGALSAATGTFAGALSAATGTFAGDISAASGTFSGGLNIKSAASGERMEIKTNVIKVFDSSGNLRVRIGNLAA